MSTMKIVCRSCGGTGLYRGSSEWFDSAVVCIDCAGAGGIDLEYEEFKGRRPAQHIKRVFKAVAGVRHSHKDVDGIQYSKAGCTYAAWIKGAAPLPVRDVYCPYRWTWQTMKNLEHPAHDLYELTCVHLLGGDHIERCPRHQDPSKLAACWRRFDELTSKGEHNE
jgi:hypothetical protein